jgi:nucleoside-diphosphate-sugar epimerase
VFNLRTRSKKLKRIGVTGAFGFLGANFIAALLRGRDWLGLEEGGIRIRAFASRTRSNPIFDAAKVSVESLDILDQGEMTGKFSGLDAVAHFAGLVDYRSTSKRSVWDTDVLGTRRVFEAALAAGVSKLLYVSSVCALGDGARGGASPAGLADEGTAPYGDSHWPTSFASPTDALAAVEASAYGDYGFLEGARVSYLDAKLAGWELAKVYARDRGLPVVTIFPGTAVGSGDLHRAISKLIDNVWEGRLRLSFEGSTSFVGVRDLAEGAVLALARGKPGEGYVVAGRDRDNLSYADFQGIVADLARSEGWLAERRPLVLPRSLLLGLAAAAERAMPNGSLTKAFVLSGSLRNVCSSAKARAELGYEPGMSLETAILECRRFGEEQREAMKPAGGRSLSPVLRSQ